MQARSDVLLVALGGAVGAAARYGLLQAFPVQPGRLPLTTGAINVGGAFVLGVLLEWLVRHRDESHWARPLVGVGVLGAFTTFSTFAVELARLARDGHTVLAVAYGLGSLVVGIGAVLAGLVAAGWRRPPVPAEGES
ncbi:MAG TPA: fluoride efflux transporter CrcB [Acidimicrobiia bacterium]|nr:fluoride efflux transporter CrcB [Acidimicrobiia bacterium]